MSSSHAAEVQADELVPRHGDPSYAVTHYDLDLRYRAASNNVTATAVLDVVLAVDTRTVTLDLHALKVSAVTVTGVVAGATLRSWSHRRGRLVLTFAAVLPAAAQLSVTVRYGGTPRLVPGPDGPCGWEELTDGVLVASQPYGAPSWYPCNDRPSDKATYRITVRAGSGYVAVANGRLVETKTSGSTTAWTYQTDQPMAPYLATVHIGRYVVRSLPGPVPLRLVYPRARAAGVTMAFADQARMVEVFERLFGPYPFDEYTVVVTDDPLEIPVEAQTLSTFGSNHLRRDWDAQRLIAHELSHQWFGNSVTVGRWRDIWLHEGFACHAEWLWSELSGGVSAAEHAGVHWRRLAALPQDLVLAAPDASRLFDDRVYKRGALFLHTLRVTYGDEEFFAMVRQWLEVHRYGTVSTDDFVALASARLDARVSALAQAWLHRPALPPLPAAP